MKFIMHFPTIYAAIFVLSFEVNYKRFFHDFWIVGHLVCNLEKQLFLRCCWNLCLEKVRDFFYNICGRKLIMKFEGFVENDIDKNYNDNSCGVWNSSTPQYEISTVFCKFLCISLNVLVRFFYIYESFLTNTLKLTNTFKHTYSYKQNTIEISNFTQYMQYLYVFFIYGKIKLEIMNPTNQSKKSHVPHIKAKKNYIKSVQSNIYNSNVNHPT